jgi:hypothetical protein
MEIKGTAVKATIDYVKERQKNVYQQWINSLPENSKKIMSNMINSTEWYSLTDAVVIPTEKLAETMKKPTQDIAYEIGRYSAEVALKGVYKIFVLISTPSFMLARATNIFSTYYRPADIKLLINEPKHALFEFRKFSEREIIIAYRIGGWIEKALTVVNQSLTSSEITKRNENGELIFNIDVKWK